ncbi:hypothetical protein [Tumebacillus lipolyticus]|uniref:DUF4491 domain-containing protein n=1 Tax=Tumebacillus lipolyticus TaxID=1280370 RepID=A0ABW5A1U0_9BACL
MSVWMWLLQVVVFFVALKVGQVVFWNLRKGFYLHPWLIELLVAVLVVIGVSSFYGGWWFIIFIGLLFGFLRGDQEEEVRANRNLL